MGERLARPVPRCVARPVSRCVQEAHLSMSTPAATTSCRRGRGIDEDSRGGMG